MRKALVIIGMAAFFTFSLACSRGGDESSETDADNGAVADVMEEPVEESEITDDIHPYHDEDLNLVGPLSDENRTCVYCSGVNPGEPELTASDLPKEVTDEIFGDYKLISVYYSKTNDYGDALDLIIEFSEPYFSPYIGGVTVDSIELYRGSSSGAKELRYSGPVGPGVESTWHETHLLTYSVDVGEPYIGTATFLEFDMTYDLEDYGTGKIKASLWMEP